MGNSARIRRIDIEDKYLFPESGTSDGSQIKYKKDGYWYKIDNRGGEGLAEYLATLVLRNSSLPADAYASYEQAIINGRAGCRCKDCLKAGESLVSFYRLWANVRGGDIATAMQRMDYDDAIEEVLKFTREQTALDLHRYLADNLALAMFIRNEDLHYNNLWVVFDGKKFREAPIMDNGRSMLVGNRRYDRERSIRENIKETFSKSFSGSFELNYRYLEKWCSFRIERSHFMSELEKEPDSFQKELLLYQIDHCCEDIIFTDAGEDK